MMPTQLIVTSPTENIFKSEKIYVEWNLIPRLIVQLDYPGRSYILFNLANVVGLMWNRILWILTYLSFFYFHIFNLGFDLQYFPEYWTVFWSESLLFQTSVERDREREQNLYELQWRFQCNCVLSRLCQVYVLAGFVFDLCIDFRLSCTSKCQDHTLERLVAFVLRRAVHSPTE